MMTLEQFDSEFLARLGTALAAQLPEFLPKQRWFRSKARTIHSAHLVECIPVPLRRSFALISFANIEFSDGCVETYALPLVAHSAPSGIARSAVIRLATPNPEPELALMDAFEDQEFLAAILSAIQKSDSLEGQNGALRAAAESALRESSVESASLLPARRLGGEQSNTSIVYGDRLILKFFRLLEEGVHPDLEIGHFLTAVAHFPNVPPLYGSLKYDSRESKASVLGILQGFVPNRGNAWNYTVDSLVELFCSADHPTNAADRVAYGSSEGWQETLRWIGLLGQRTAELHLALSSSSADPDFAPEPFTLDLREGLATVFHNLTVRNFETLRLKSAELPQRIAGLAAEVLKMEDDALLILHSVLERDINTVRIRIHGDYHLGQVLFTGSDYFIIDFEGEPARPLGERRNKRCALQDVAGMLRSFHYAARAASDDAAKRLAAAGKPAIHLGRVATQWQALASEEFLRSYRSAAGDARFLPANPDEFEALLRVFLLDKAIYELGYELNNRPSWISIPLEGIRDILAAKS